jgi:hypothetical protein
MAGRVATISGTMLTPGVSRNRRLYTPEVIASAAKRMQERIADPKGLPIVMRSHHEAGDDSVRIVGALRSVTIGEDGSASYTADLFDTTHGRDIATLVTPGKDQPPALRSVSIHGYWLGPVKTVTYEGESVSTASDLEVDAVDFTASPGVLGATVDNATWVRPGDTAESTGGRTPISESMEATVEAVTEVAPTEELSAKAKQTALAKGQAMKNANGDPSYTIKSKADLRRAIKAVGRGGADHDKIRAHIIKRAGALGLSALIPDNWNKDGSMKETTTRYSDIREYYDGPGGAAGFCIDAYNGPTSLTIRNCSIDPADLRVVAAAAMDAAINALQAVDPDMDGDVDVPGAPLEDTDDDMDGTGETTAPAESAPPAPEALTQTSRADQAGDRTHQEDAIMAETTETAAPARSFTDADFAAMGAIFGSALKEAVAPVLAAVTEAKAVAPAPVEAAPVAPVAPAAPAPVAAVETAPTAPTAADITAAFETRLTEALAKQRDDLRESMLKEYGPPSRQGYRVHENDKAPDDAEDLYADRANILLGSIGIGAQPAAQ